jgi:SAM-dependent methyltransferase
MFSCSARFYDALYAWKDYAAENVLLHALIEARVPGARTLLDVACGTGVHLAELQAWYAVEGVDLDPAMLEIARERLPGVPLHEGDMVTLDLGREFDVVTCLFSSIGYAVTRERLRETAASLARHVAPGGLLVVEPWITPDEWDPGLVHALFVDEPDLKIARMTAGAPAGDTVTLDFEYLVATPAGTEHFIERHVAGMFTDVDYRGALEAAGLEVEHDPEGLMGRGLYLGGRAA